MLKFRCCLFLILLMLFFTVIMGMQGIEQMTIGEMLSIFSYNDNSCSCSGSERLEMLGITFMVSPMQLATAPYVRLSRPMSAPLPGTLGTHDRYRTHRSYSAQDRVFYYISD